MKRFTYRFFPTLHPVTISGGRAKLAVRPITPRLTPAPRGQAIQDLPPDGDAAAEEGFPRQLILRRSVAEGVSPNFAR
jgi:hypothetical protein